MSDVKHIVKIGTYWLKEEFIGDEPVLKLVRYWNEGTMWNALEPAELRANKLGGRVLQIADPSDITSLGSTINVNPGRVQINSENIITGGLIRETKTGDPFTVEQKKYIQNEITDVEGLLATVTQLVDGLDQKFRELRNDMVITQSTITALQYQRKGLRNKLAKLFK